MSEMENTEKISDYILTDVAQALGHDEDDGDWLDNEKIVKRINAMGKDEILARWCQWQGLGGWGGEIKGVVMEIFGFEEDEDDG